MLFLAPSLTRCLRASRVFLAAPLFLNPLGLRVLIMLMRIWEAGVNPALPRNCKRGNRRRPLEYPGRPAAALDQSRAWLGMDGSQTRPRVVLTRRARRPARTTNLSPFRVSRKSAGIALIFPC